MRRVNASLAMMQLKMHLMWIMDMDHGLELWKNNVDCRLALARARTADGPLRVSGVWERLGASFSPHTTSTVRSTGVARSAV
jgi:hypothetical protein